MIPQYLRHVFCSSFCNYLPWSLSVRTGVLRYRISEFCPRNWRVIIVSRDRPIRPNYLHICCSLLKSPSHSPTLHPLTDSITNSLSCDFLCKIISFPDCSSPVPWLQQTWRVHHVCWREAEHSTAVLLPPSVFFSSARKQLLPLYRKTCAYRNTASPSACEAHIVSLVVPFVRAAIGYSIKDDELSATCGTRGRQESTNSWYENWNETDLLDLRLYRRIILKFILKKYCRVVWTGVIHMAENRDCWYVAVNTAPTHGLSSMRGIPCLLEQLLGLKGDCAGLLVFVLRCIAEPLSHPELVILTFFCFYVSYRAWIRLQ